jgi:hypothetical protein
MSFALGPQAHGDPYGPLPSGFVVLLVVLAATSGCSQSPGSQPTMQRVPQVHRTASATNACMDPPPPGHTVQGPATSPCYQDSDCDAGLNPRCYTEAREVGSSVALYNACASDSCITDSDCGDGGVCNCRDPDLDNTNVCLTGNCRIDSDCGPHGYCSPSGLSELSACAADFVSLVGHCLCVESGFYCHTPRDQCIDDTDCSDSGAIPCAFNRNAGFWQCNGGCADASF